VDFVWHPDAVAEADAAAAFYADKQRQLGTRFVNSLNETLGRISINPDGYRKIEPGIHKIRLKTFPYVVIYRVKGVIEIIAVMHIRREPGYWKDRS
jgi:plasmid stabilization system protein ParE